MKKIYKIGIIGCGHIAEKMATTSIEAIENGWIESPFMPHSETIRVMEQMDSLRKDWGVVYEWD